MGYDVAETKIIEANAEFHALAAQRLNAKYPGELVPAEQALGSLDE